MTPDEPRPEATEQSRADTPPSTPRWVKNLLWALLAVVVVAVLVMLIAGGEHGPGRHGSLGSEDSITHSASLAGRR